MIYVVSFLAGAQLALIIYCIALHTRVHQQKKMVIDLATVLGTNIFIIENLNRVVIKLVETLGGEVIALKDIEPKEKKELN